MPLNKETKPKLSGLDAVLCMLTNEYSIHAIARKLLLLKKEYLKPYKWVQIIDIQSGDEISSISFLKFISYSRNQVL